MGRILGEREKRGKGEKEKRRNGELELIRTTKLEATRWLSGVEATSGVWGEKGDFV
jgi:hypothetical protein